MNKEDAKRLADRMTYSEAIMNCFYAKGIRYRKATKIKLNELLEIANRLDKQEKPGELKYVGYSSHDSESRYQCPVCKEGYGGWDFINGSVRAVNGLFRCKCGKLLKKPE